MADIRSLIAQGAQQRGLDPRAVLAIASVEGGFNGAVGDNGTSFGPFQLHKGGALPSVANPQQFANSAAGINYALDGIQKVAGGLKGQAAISAISSKFERPADVAGEIAKASARYGGFGQAGPNLFGSGPAAQGTITSLPTGGSAPSNPFQSLATQLISGGTDNPILKLAEQRYQLAAANRKFGSTPSAGTNLTPQVPGQQGGLVQPVLDKGQSAKSAQAVALTKQYLGTPYVWGGESPKGFDCSGLLQYVWGKQGVSIPRTTYDQFKAGTAVSKGNLEPGDAVFFKGSDSKGGLPGHVGMYLGNGKFIEAPHTGASVRVSTLAGRTDYVGARRYA